MRILVRSFVLFALLTAVTAQVQSQGLGGGGSTGSGGGLLGGGGGGGGQGVNQLLFAPGSPSPTTGGVTMAINIIPTTGYTCTSITISAVDQNANTLASVTIQNPGPSVNQTFSSLGSGVMVDVVVNSVYQNGIMFDYPYLEGTVTTN